MQEEKPPPSKPVLLSIINAACEGRVDDVEALVTLNEIDVNAPLFEVPAPWLGNTVVSKKKEDDPFSQTSAPWLGHKGSSVKDSQPLFHAWLYHCFVMNETCPLEEEVRSRMMTMMVKKLGSNLIVERQSQGEKDFTYYFKDDGMLYFRPCGCDEFFNAMDFAWFQCMRNRWLGGGEEKDDAGPILTTLMQLEELEPDYTRRAENITVIYSMCSVFAHGLVCKLWVNGFGVPKQKWLLGHDVIKSMFSTRRWEHHGWLYLLKCNCEGTLRFVIKVFNDYSSINWLNSCGNDPLSRRILDLYSKTMANDPNRHKLATMMEILMRKEVCKHFKVALVSWAYGPVYNTSAQRSVEMLLPVSDPMKRLAVRAPAIEQDNLERWKLTLFFAKSKWGKMLGRDIIQGHILPRVVVLCGKDQAKLDSILDGHRIPTEVRECAFYYKCLMARARDAVAIVGEFRFMQFLMGDEGRQEYEETMQRLQPALQGVYDDDRIAGMVMGALRVSFNDQKGEASCILGVPSACPEPRW